jgi:crooked neck
MSASRGPPRVKNKSAAPLQISAEQLLKEAVTRTEETVQAPTQKLEDLEELSEVQARSRQNFENYVRRNRLNLNNWLRYAAWEIEQADFQRARSVFERCLDVHAQEVRVWLRYIDGKFPSATTNDYIRLTPDS